MLNCRNVLWGGLTCNIFCFLVVLGGGLLCISTISNMRFCRTPAAYQIIVADAADAVSVNFSGRCKFFSDLKQKIGNLLCIWRNNAKNWQNTVYFVVIYAFFQCKFYSPKILPV